jgi:ATP-dependent DNA ligase
MPGANDAKPSDMKDVPWRAFADSVRGLSVDRAFIDGEAVVLREDGRSDFGALMTKRGGAQASLVAFDLLRHNGDDLRLRPLEARREALMRLIGGADGVLFNEALTPRARSCSPRRAKPASKASSRSDKAASIGTAEAAIG